MRVTLPSLAMTRSPQEYHGFLASMKRALSKAGCDVVEFSEAPPENTKIHTRWLSLWEEDGKSAWVCVDWSDETMPRFSVQRKVDDSAFEGAISAYFKMKLCDRNSEFYQQWPTFPGGYFLGPGMDDNGAKSLWYLGNLDRLRGIKDTAHQCSGIYTRGAYRERTRCPARTNLWSPDLYQGECDYVNFQRHLEHVAQSKAVLSLSGPHMTIDRKVLECFGIGVAMVSDLGLQDLQLPYGRRIEHEKHVVYVESARDIKKAARRIDQDDDFRLSLEANSRALFEECFEEFSLGKWYVDNVRRVMA